MSIKIEEDLDKNLKIQLIKAQIEKCELERDNIELLRTILKKRHKEASTISSKFIFSYFFCFFFFFIYIC